MDKTAGTNQTMKIIPFTKLHFLEWISLAVLIVFLGFTVVFGFNTGIDFSSGLKQSVEIDTGKAPDVTIKTLRESLKGLPSLQVQALKGGDLPLYSVRVRLLKDKQGKEDRIVTEKAVRDRLNQSPGTGAYRILSSGFIGPRLAGQLTGNTITLTLITLVLILLYIWFRFKLVYAVAAIGALLHDTLFLLGFIGISRLEFSSTSVAAILIIIGYSLNDTIVIFDRIRENEEILPHHRFDQIIDISITQSLSRTIITSLTTFIAVLSMAVIARGAIQAFAIQLLFGIVVGTLSSIFVASNIVNFWRERKIRRLNAQNRKDRDSRKGSDSKKKTEPSGASEESDTAETSKGKITPFKPLQSVSHEHDQTAEEIRLATERKRKKKIKKKKH